MKRDRCHAHVGCVQCCHTNTVDAMKREICSDLAIRLVRRRMTGTIRNILISDDSELIGRDFLIAAPVGDEHPDFSVVHVTADNVCAVRFMATNNNLNIYELIVTEE